MFTNNLTEPDKNFTAPFHEFFLSPFIYVYRLIDVFPYVETYFYYLYLPDLHFRYRLWWLARNTACLHTTRKSAPNSKALLVMAISIGTKGGKERRD